jgi:hypothetical protein
MALRDAGSAGNNCMLLSVLAAAGLPPDAMALRGRIADAIDAMTISEREAFVKDVVEPGQAVADPSAVLGPTYVADFDTWSKRVRTGSSMLGAAELHVLRGILAADGIDVEVTSLRSLTDSKTAAAWARTQRAAHSGTRKLVLIATDGGHYNWVPPEEELVAKAGKEIPAEVPGPAEIPGPAQLRGGGPGARGICKKKSSSARPVVSVLRMLASIPGLWIVFAFVAFRVLTKFKA